jgi:hypothetical protein
MTQDLFSCNNNGKTPILACYGHPDKAITVVGSVNCGRRSNHLISDTEGLAAVPPRFCRFVLIGYR